MGDDPMAYKFNIGDIVVLRREASPTAPGGVFEIIKRLPGGSEPEYHIKSVNEPHQRLAKAKSTGLRESPIPRTHLVFGDIEGKLDILRSGLDYFLNVFLAIFRGHRAPS